MRTNYEKELKNLNVELIKMGVLVRDAIVNVISVIENNDRKLAKKIIENDGVIDDEEKSIQGRCLSLILKQQPVASDLRVVSTAIKMVTDLERIGDHASDISEIVLSEENYKEIPAILSELAKSAEYMVDGAVFAYANNDVEKAKKVGDYDDKVDELFIKAKNEIIDMLKDSNIADDACINSLMIAKYFERIGDHSKNICEWVEFNATGEYKNKRIL